MNIILLGFSNSGKSLIADYLFQRYNFKKYEIGEYVIKSYLKQDRFKYPIDYCDYLHKKHQLNIFVNEMIKDARLEQGDKVFVGPRSIEEITIIKKAYKDSVMVGVISADKIRVKRYNHSKKKIENRGLTERDQIERKWGLNDSLIKMCDYCIYNYGTVNNCYLEIDKMISYFKRK